MNDRIQEIIDALDKDDGVYKREQVNAALELKEEITPHLINILERILIDPDKYLEEDHFAHMYAVILLGHFREPKAHKAIADVFSLPNDLPHEIFGDLTTAHLPAVLFLTCNGSLDVIKNFASNKDAYQFCRISALDALVYAVVAGMAPREEIMSFYAGLFTGAEAEPDSYFWSGVASCVCDLYPEELMDVIKRGYEDGLIWPGYIGFDEFEEALHLRKDHAFKQARENMGRRMPDDVHSCISWWACFDPKERALSSPTHVDAPRLKEPRDPRPLPGDKTAKNKAKAARRKAKAAKKKKGR